MELRVLKTEYAADGLLFRVSLVEDVNVGWCLLRGARFQVFQFEASFTQSLTERFLISLDTR